jgi:transposase InsO family protein
LSSGNTPRHGVLASVGSVGDAYDNAMAESFVDSFKTELIADRFWRSPPGPVPPPATLCRPSISVSSAIP